MPTRNYKPEQIVTILRQIEVQMANGKTAPQSCKEAEIHTQTYYRWRKEYGGLKLEQAKRLKELEKENTLRKRLVEELPGICPETAIPYGRPSGKANPRYPCHVLNLPNWSRRKGRPAVG